MEVGRTVLCCTGTAMYPIVYVHSRSATSTFFFLSHPDFSISFYDVIMRTSWKTGTYKIFIAALAQRVQFAVFDVCNDGAWLKIMQGVAAAASGCCSRKLLACYKHFIEKFVALKNFRINAVHIERAQHGAYRILFLVFLRRFIFADTTEEIGRMKKGIGSEDESSYCPRLRLCRCARPIFDYNAIKTRTSSEDGEIKECFRLPGSY